MQSVKDHISNKRIPVVKKVIFTVVVVFGIFFPLYLNAAVKTVVKEYTYQASELDNKVSCRTLAMIQVKRLFLEELGTYLESITEITNFQITNDAIKSITAGFVKTKVLNEKWDGKTYWVKVEMTADPEDVKKSIQNTLDRSDLIHQLMLEKRKADNALREIEKLKKDIEKLGKNKGEAQKAYNISVKTLFNHEKWLKEYSLISKGWRAHDSGNYNDALNIANKLLLDSNNEFFKCSANLLIGASYSGKGYFDKSLDKYTASLKLCPKEYEGFIYSLLGQTFIKIKNYDKGIEYLRRSLRMAYDEKKEIISSSNDDGEISEALIDISISDRHLDIVSALLTKIRDTPGAGTHSDDLVKFPEEAFSELKAVLRIKPRSMRSLRILHKFGGGPESNREIINWCDKLLRIWPNNDEIYYIRGTNYHRLKDYKKALDDLTKALSIDLNNPMYYVQRALSYMLVGVKNEALNDLNKAISVDPTFGDAYLWRGVINGNYDDMKVAARLGSSKAKKVLKMEGVSW